MKVYSVLRCVQYEREDLLGVFGSREDALVFAKRHLSKYHDMGIVESELGQTIDFDYMVEWVE